MAIFEKGKLKVISDKGEADLSKAAINKDLSAVGYDSDLKFFYMTIDKLLFSDPVSTIKKVLDAHKTPVRKLKWVQPLMRIASIFIGAE